MIGLNAEPFDAMLPKAFRIAGKEDFFPGAGDAHCLCNQFLLINPEGRDAVLYTDDHIKLPIVKSELDGVHLEEMAERPIADHFPRQQQAVM